MSDPLTMSTCCPPDSGEVVPVIRCAGRWFNEIRPETDMAETVAGFIRRRFFHAYGAEPSLRIPALLALTTAQGTLLAAVGVRNAALEKLFLEDYLSVPVESVMPNAGIERHRIAEIAHLAGVEAGVSRFLFASLSVWLDSAGYDWVVWDCEKNTGTGTQTTPASKQARSARIQPMELSPHRPARRTPNRRS